MNSVRLLMTATWTAYRDVGRALAAMPVIALVAIIVIFGGAVFNLLVADRIVPASSLLGRDITTLVSNLLITPVLIAVHRFIILGEVTRQYELNLQDTRLQLFFGWTTVLFVTESVLAALVKISGVYSQAGVAAVMMGFFFIMLRMTILFPAIAVGAPAATVDNAIADVKGHGWYILGLLIIIVLTPQIIVLAIIGAIVGAIIFGASAVMPSWLLSLLPLLVLGGGVVLVELLLVAIASRLYMTLGDRVNQPSSDS